MAQTQPPTFLGVNRTRPREAVISWTNNGLAGATYDGIRVLLRNGPAGTWWRHSAITGSAIQSQTVTIYDLAWSADYEIALQAYGPGGGSAYSTVRSIDAWVTPTPRITDAVRTSATAAEIVASWSGPVDAVRYEKRIPGGAWQFHYQQNGSPLTRWLMVDLNGTVGYEWRIRTAVDSVYSDFSNTETTPAYYRTPAAPSDVVAVASTPTETTLRWSAANLGSAGARWAKLAIQQSTNDGPFVTIAPLLVSSGGAPPTSHKLSRLAQNRYAYRIIAYNAAGQASSPSSTATLDAAIRQPATPSAPNAAWTADWSAIELTWSYTATAERPITAFKIERAPYGGGTPTTWTISSALRSWKDTTAPSNGRYVYRMQAVHAPSNQVSDWGAQTGIIYTTPKPPTKVTATRVGLNINLAWSLSSPSTATSWLILHSTDRGGTSFPLATVPAGARSWTHYDAAGDLSHIYWVVPVLEGAPPEREPRGTASNYLHNTSPPLAPYVEQPVSRDPGEDVELRWKHNPIDGTEQTWASVWHRKLGAAEWSKIRVDGDAQSWLLPAGTYQSGDRIEWQVSTRGADAAWSPGSLVTTLLRSRPTVTIALPMAPGQTNWDSPEFTFAWFTTASPQTKWVADLISGGDTVASRTGTTGRSATFAGLETGKTYLIQLRVWDDLQPSNYDTTPLIAVVIVGPPAPAVFATPDPDQVSVVIEATATEAEAVEVWWRTDTSEWAYLADTGNDNAYLHAWAPVGVPIHYKARARNARGGWTDSEPVTVTLDVCDIVVNWGPGQGKLARAGWNPTMQGDSGRDVTLVRYAGWDADVAYWGERQPRTVKAAAIIGWDGSSIPEWQAAAEYPGTIVYRDPAGRVVTGVMQGMSWDDSTWDADDHEISFTVSEVGA